jgi:hypothetical protein
LSPYRPTNQMGDKARDEDGLFRTNHFRALSPLQHHHLPTNDMGGKAAGQIVRLCPRYYAALPPLPGMADKMYQSG